MFGQFSFPFFFFFLVQDSDERNQSRICTHEMRLSIEESMGFVLRDLRKEVRFGVRESAVEGMANEMRA